MTDRLTAAIGSKRASSLPEEKSPGMRGLAQEAGGQDSGCQLALVEPPPELTREGREKRRYQQHLAACRVTQDCINRPNINTADPRALYKGPGGSHDLLKQVLDEIAVGEEIIVTVHNSYGPPSVSQGRFGKYYYKDGPDVLFPYYVVGLDTTDFGGRTVSEPLYLYRANDVEISLAKARAQAS